MKRRRRCSSSAGIQPRLPFLVVNKQSPSMGAAGWVVWLDEWCGWTTAVAGRQEVAERWNDKRWAKTAQISEGPNSVPTHDDLISKITPYSRQCKPFQSNKTFYSYSILFGLHTRVRCWLLSSLLKPGSGWG